MGSVGPGVRVHLQLEGWAVHFRQWLMGASVERQTRVMLQYYVFEFLCRVCVELSVQLGWVRSVCPLGAAAGGSARPVVID